MYTFVYIYVYTDFILTLLLDSRPPCLREASASAGCTIHGQVGHQGQVNQPGPAAVGPTEPAVRHKQSQQ